ncbi:putative FmdB family regulatory protein [Rhodoferax ferrireducens]|uniref:FmdB family regulatory protein n=1 Tax=Rhodoferax ferrireducens TaxID=192843 RepID=A0ABU2C329_9BURK|nr:FmdB family zinc ribbon protein [Rhodoferax ferrireducens]MDR7375744.1 putative FmdB family regulatory protein [Rhodoferax ferrireducens]
MPTYDYDCTACGSFEAFRSLGQRNEPLDCPGCGLAAARLMTLSAEPRRAGSAHAQSVENNYKRLSHRAGCACC